MDEKRQALGVVGYQLAATQARCSDRLRQNIGNEGVGERGRNRTYNLLIKS